MFARWRLTGTHTGGQFNGIDTTGKSVSLDGMDQFTFRDGKMASNFVVFDQMEVGRQLGLLPPDGSPPDRALKAAFNAKTKIAEAIRKRRGSSARRSSALRGCAARPRGSARRSSISAVSATGTPVRCSSRPSKSATIARTAAA